MFLSKLIFFIDISLESGVNCKNLLLGSPLSSSAPRRRRANSMRSLFLRTHSLLSPFLSQLVLRRFGLSRFHAASLAAIIMRILTLCPHHHQVFFRGPCPVDVSNSKQSTSYKMDVRLRFIHHFGSIFQKKKFDVLINFFGKSDEFFSILAESRFC